MNRPCKVRPSRRSPPTEEEPLLLGCYQRRLDSDRRLRLPTVWAPGNAQTWLLYPQKLYPHCKEVAQMLYLLPTGEESLRSNISGWPGNTVKAPTLGALLEILRGRARRFSLPPDIATAIRINPASTRFALTKAQIDWLGCRGRVLTLTGVAISARICTPAVWAKWLRDTKRHLATADFKKLRKA